MSMIESTARQGQTAIRIEADTDRHRTVKPKIVEQSGQHIRCEVILDSHADIQATSTYNAGKLIHGPAMWVTH
jgi:hypothetical protein